MSTEPQTVVYRDRAVGKEEVLAQHKRDLIRRSTELRQMEADLLAKQHEMNKVRRMLQPEREQAHVQLLDSLEDARPEGHRSQLSRNPRPIHGRPSQSLAI